MLVSVGKTCTFLRVFPALNRRLKNASPASCDALRITFSVTLFCAPNERLDPKMDHRLLVIKNPPRFFFAQPPSRTRRSQLSRAHTHFHTPQTFENTNQFPVWPTVSPYLSQYPPDSRQQLSSVLSHLTLFSFSAYAPHVFSTRLLIQSPSLSPSPFQRNEPPSSLGLRPSQVSQSLRSHDCSLHLNRLAYAYLFPVFAGRCSIAPHINRSNFTVTLRLSATALFLPSMHRFKVQLQA